MPEEIKPLSLEDAASHLLEECRMVLPGIQALFGFQLVAVFDAQFSKQLSAGEQELHLAAIVCVVLAIALVMAPAALHRMREPLSVSRRFLELSTRLLMFGMVPLAVGTTLDVYLVGRVIAHSYAIAGVAAGSAVVAFVGFWGVLPMKVRLTES